MLRVSGMEAGLDTYLLGDLGFDLWMQHAGTLRMHQQYGWS
jgi:hypothetical protein